MKQDFTPWTVEQTIKRIEDEQILHQQLCRQVDKANKQINIAIEAKRVACNNVAKKAAYINKLKVQLKEKLETENWKEV